MSNLSKSHEDLPIDPADEQLDQPLQADVESAQTHTPGGNTTNSQGRGSTLPSP